MYVIMGDIPVRVVNPLYHHTGNICRVSCFLGLLVGGWGLGFLGVGILKKIKSENIWGSNTPIWPARNPDISPWVTAHVHGSPHSYGSPHTALVHCTQLRVTTQPRFSSHLQTFNWYENIHNMEIHCQSPPTLMFL